MTLKAGFMAEVPSPVNKEARRAKKRPKKKLCLKGFKCFRIKSRKALSESFKKEVLLF